MTLKELKNKIEHIDILAKYTHIKVNKNLMKVWSYEISDVAKNKIAKLLENENLGKNLYSYYMDEKSNSREIVKINSINLKELISYVKKLENKAKKMFYIDGVFKANSAYSSLQKLYNLYQELLWTINKKHEGLIQFR